MPGVIDALKTSKRPEPEATSRQSLRDQAYEIIKRRIITLAYHPGAYINEAMICDDLGIGRTPVHLALERLALEGMVEIMPRKGLIVTPISFDEMQQINEARRLIEPAAAGLAARWASDAELEAMKRIVAAAREVRLHDTERLMELDRLFHSAIADATRNRVLAPMLKALHERSLRNWYISLSDEGRRENVAAEHEEILGAILTRDAAVAEAAMRSHIDSFKERAEGLA